MLPYTNMPFSPPSFPIIYYTYPIILSYSKDFAPFSLLIVHILLLLFFSHTFMVTMGNISLFLFILFLLLFFGLGFFFFLFFTHSLIHKEFLCFLPFERSSVSFLAFHSYMLLYSHPISSIFIHFHFFSFLLSFFSFLPYAIS